MKKKCVLTLLTISFIIFFNTGCLSPSWNTVAVTELFTAIWNVSCTFSQYAIDEIYKDNGRDKFIAIEYYVDSKVDHPYPRLSCQESWERMNWYMKDKGVPTAFFNGIEYLKSVPNPDDDSTEGKKTRTKEAYIEKMKKCNAVFPPVKLYATCEKNGSNDNYLISLSIEAIDELSYSSLMLNIALIESNIEYEAINGYKIHNHVFREWIKPPEIKDTIGIPLTLSTTGDLYKTEVPFHLNTELYKKDMSIILFVQDMDTKTILQGLEISGF